MQQHALLQCPISVHITGWFCSWRQAVSCFSVLKEYRWWWMCFFSRSFLLLVYSWHLHVKCFCSTHQEVHWVRLDDLWRCRSVTCVFVCNISQQVKVNLCSILKHHFLCFRWCFGSVSSVKFAQMKCECAPWTSTRFFTLAHHALFLTNPVAVKTVWTQRAILNPLVCLAQISCWTQRWSLRLHHVFFFNSLSTLICFSFVHLLFDMFPISKLLYFWSLI